MKKGLYVKLVILLAFLILLVGSWIVYKSKFDMLAYTRVDTVLYNDNYLVGIPLKWKGLIKPKINEIYFTKNFEERVQKEFLDNFKCYVSSDMSIGTSLKSEISKINLKSYRNYQLKGENLNLIVETDPNNVIKFKKYKFLVIDYKICFFHKKVFLDMSILQLDSI